MQLARTVLAVVLVALMLASTTATALEITLLPDSQTSQVNRSVPLYATATHLGSLVGVGNTIHMTRVPTQDITGAIRYLDVDITLNVTEAGVIDAATVVFVESPPLLTNEFVPGNYSEVTGAQCQVSLGVALEGRTVGVLNCTGSSIQRINATWHTGSIAGHPFEPDLLAAGIDQIPGHENLSWGKVGFVEFKAFSCFRESRIIGGNQVGNVVAVNHYGTDTSVDCGHNFTRVKP